MDRKYDKCSGCNKKKSLQYGNVDLCTGCHSAQFQSVNSGNSDIDNLIKATQRNNIQFRLEWIPFEDFIDIQKVAEGGFSMIFTAKWRKGRVKSYSKGKFNRTGPITIVLKILKDSQNINSAFIKELQNITETQPNSSIRNLVHYYGKSRYWN
ncbi:7683_t:CDS:2 [Acaulospora morrowiae]|uniref:7683_t:CDS:1 n=1 Tax=Acaulospora morrowiae TaxID=94023 RepID=A0A9N9HAZ8_9GLOM|nr:7683_t:CDS:2 [Acaulospora morrowiae]